MLTLGGQILQSDVDGVATLRSGNIEVREGKIVGIDFGDISPQVDVGDEETLISPGFIDAHLHLPQFDSIGASGMPLLVWLNEVIFPAEAKWNAPDYAASMISRVARQCLSVGTTGICAFATSSYESTEIALDQFGRFGFRGVIGQALMDQMAPSELLRPLSQLTEELSRSLTEHPPHHRLSAAVTPRYALSCSEDLMEMAAGLALEQGAMIQTHLAETKKECDVVETHYGGKRYVDVYRDAGLLGPRSLFGHGIYLDGLDRSKLADSNSIIVHCPTANSFLGSGEMDRFAHLRADVPLALGSDIGAGFERSMVRVGRSMIETAIRVARIRGAEFSDPDHVPTAGHAWHQITAGNADTLGWEDAGRIRVGMPADLLVIRPDIPWRHSRQPLSTLMFAWDDRWLRRTILSGKVRYRFPDAFET